MTCEHFRPKKDIGRAEFVLPNGSKAIVFEGASGNSLEEGEGICGAALDLTGGRFAVCPIPQSPRKNAEGCILNPRPGQAIKIILPDDL